MWCSVALTPPQDHSNAGEEVNVGMAWDEESAETSSTKVTGTKH